MTRWPVILCVLLLATSSGRATAAETRGTLVEAGGRDKIRIRDSQGQPHEFKSSAGIECRWGIDYGRTKDITLLPAGTKVIVEHEGNQALAVLEAWGWYEALGVWLDESFTDMQDWSRKRFGEDALLSNQSDTKAVLSIVLVSLICGLASSMVVTNRMAFFSDALAHCSFAGVALGWILFLSGAASGDSGILATMVVFGVLVGLAIAFVREQTSLANDTVIGVFFAGAMGLGAVLLRGISSTGSGFSPENFVFGFAHGVLGQDLVFLVLLLFLLVGFYLVLFNRLVFSSFNPSLARARSFPVRLGNYLLIVMLGLIINVCLKTVGALLISALLVVPAASASNLSRNLRQFFWVSVGLSAFSGMIGAIVCRSWHPIVGGREISLGDGGMIVVLSVVIFFVSLPLARWLKGGRVAARTGF